MTDFKDWAEIVDEVIQDVAKACDGSATLTLEENRATWNADRHTCNAVAGAFGKTIMVSIDGAEPWMCQLLADDLVRYDGGRIANRLFRE
jgi:hypothetical protein